MLTSNVVIWSPLLNFLVPFRLRLPPPSPPTEAGCNWLEHPLVVREQFFRRLVGYVFNCSRAELDPIVLVLWSFYAINRFFWPICFLALKKGTTGSARSGRAALLEPNALLVSKCAVRLNCFEETISRRQRRFFVWKCWHPQSPQTLHLSRSRRFGPPSRRALHNPNAHHLTPSLRSQPIDASLSPSWLIPKPTAHQLFESNSPDVSGVRFRGFWSYLLNFCLWFEVNFYQSNFEV